MRDGYRERREIEKGAGGYTTCAGQGVDAEEKFGMQGEEEGWCDGGICGCEGQRGDECTVEAAGGGVGEVPDVEMDVGAIWDPDVEGVRKVWGCGDANGATDGGDPHWFYGSNLGDLRRVCVSLLVLGFARWGIVGSLDTYLEAWKC